MAGAIRRMRRARRGAVLVEFAISVLLFVTVLLSSVDWALEVYARMSLERSLAASMRVYSVTRDETAARDAAIQATAGILSNCLQPIDIRLHNSVIGKNIADPATGYAPTGTPADLAAVFARMELTCRWRRFTPMLASILGREVTFSVTGLTGLK